MHSGDTLKSLQCATTNTSSPDSCTLHSMSVMWKIGTLLKILNFDRPCFTIKMAFPGKGIQIIKKTVVRLPYLYNDSILVKQHFYLSYAVMSLDGSWNASTWGEMATPSTSRSVITAVLDCVLDEQLLCTEWHSCGYSSDRMCQHFDNCVEIPSTKMLTHWGRVTHNCVIKLTNIGSDNGLSPGRRQAIILTNVGLLLIGLLGTNFSEILIEILTLSIKKCNW